MTEGKMNSGTGPNDTTHSFYNERMKITTWPQSKKASTDQISSDVNTEHFLICITYYIKMYNVLDFGRQMIIKQKFIKVFFFRQNLLNLHRGARCYL